MIVLVSGVILSGAADVVTTSAGPLEITLHGHASLMFTYGGKVIYVDPFSPMADYAGLPKADLILITHHHRDHLDPVAVANIRKADSRIICSSLCQRKLPGSEAIANGDSLEAAGIGITAVAAYNLVHRREDGKPFHPRGEGNGYVLVFGDTRVYVAGDTENTPEMKALRDIDIAFLPVNLPYTMDASMVMDAVEAIKPGILYPYHFAYGKSDLEALRAAMARVPDTELRVRPKP